MSFTTLYWKDVKEGEEIPSFTKEVNATTVVAGALASRDFTPVHHDSEFAKAQGNQDIFMNIMTTCGWLEKYITGWTGPTSRLKKLGIKLKVSCYPGDALVFSGKVAKKYVDDDQHLLDLDIVAKVSRGDHVIALATISLPAPG